MTATLTPVNTTAEVQTREEVTREPERTLAPAVDIYENGEGLHVVADLPGADKDSIEISVEENVLTLKARVAPMKSEGNPVWTEFGLTNYYRQFRLGETIDRSRIGAEYKHGVLTLTLPFAPKAKPRQIAVKVN